MNEQVVCFCCEGSGKIERANGVLLPKTNLPELLEKAQETGKKDFSYQNKVWTLVDRTRWNVEKIK